MTTINTQIELDYIQAAQKRAIADMRLLRKSATITVAANSATVALPDEVLYIEAVYEGSTTIAQASDVAYMELATGLVGETDTLFTLVGRTLYVFPSKTTPRVLTLIYSYRPADITSNVTFEVGGTAERLIERLTAAYILFDDGQPELAQAELASYLTESLAVKKRGMRALGSSATMPLARQRGRRL